MQPWHQQFSFIRNRRQPYLHLLCWVVFSAVLSHGSASYEKRPSVRAVTTCAADSAIRLIQCGYTKGCIWAGFRCDGIEDCDDGSDESDASCRGGSACGSTPVPVCPLNSACRSVTGSDTRFAHHVCDCIAPFTGDNCTQTTTAREETGLSTAPPELHEGVSETAAPDLLSSTDKLTATESSIGLIDPLTTKTPPLNNTLNTSSTTFMTSNTTGFSYTNTSTMTNSTAQTITGNQTTTRQPLTVSLPTMTPTESNNNGAPASTQRQTKPTAQNINAPETTQTFTSSTATASSSIGAAKDDTGYTTQQTSLSVTPSKNQGGADLSTGAASEHVAENSITVTPPKPVPKAAQAVSSSQPPSSTDGTGHTDDDETPSNNTAVMVLVFGLLTLIPMAIFFHCRMRRKPSSSSRQKAKEKEEQDENTEEKSKPKETKRHLKLFHRRNVSISSIQLRENSTLLENELPVDINANKPEVVLPVICITPPPDVTTGTQTGPILDNKRKRRRHTQHLPDTQMWLPDNDFEELPYFVTDSHEPLPVSLV